MWAIGEAALAACPWFNDLVASSSSTRDVTAIFDAMRDSRHYVVGRSAPFRWRLAAEGEELVAAVWAGEDAGNLAGNMQGGAIGALFDVVVATLGSVTVGHMRFGTTKSLHVLFRRPVPLATVLKIRAKSGAGGFDTNTGLGAVTAIMSHSDGQELASCTAEMVDLRTRMQWKRKSRSKI